MAAGAMTALSGCGNEDTHSVTIRDASHSLEALTPRSTTAASDSYVAQQSEQIIQKLRSVTKSGNDTQKAAANELIARAQLGVAFPKGQTAHLLVTKTQGQIEIARAYYDRLILSRALETAANNYQPGPETAEIEAELTTVAAQVTQAQSAKATVDAAVSSLRAIASTKQAQAQTHRTAESKLRQSVLTTGKSVV